MEKVEIIGAPQSNYVRTVRIAAIERNIPYELIAAAPHSAEVCAIHPLGKIPVMRHGAVCLCESKAIISYLDAKFPGPRLIPDDPVKAAEIEQWVSMINVSLQPAFSAYMQGYFFGGEGGADRARIDAATPKMRDYLAIVERAVAPTQHLVGDDFSLADAYIGPVLWYLNTLPELGAAIADAPALQTYIARHEGRESYRATTPPPFAQRAA